MDHDLKWLSCQNYFLWYIIDLISLVNSTEFLFSVLPNISKCSAFAIKWLDWSWFRRKFEEVLLFAYNVKIEEILVEEVSIRKNNYLLAHVLSMKKPNQIFFVFSGIKQKVDSQGLFSRTSKRYQSINSRFVCVCVFWKSRLSSPVHKLSIAVIKKFLIVSSEPLSSNTHLLAYQRAHRHWMRSNWK